MMMIDVSLGEHNFIPQVNAEKPDKNYIHFTCVAEVSVTENAQSILSKT